MPVPVGTRLCPAGAPCCAAGGNFSRWWQERPIWGSDRGWGPKNAVCAITCYTEISSRGAFWYMGSGVETAVFGVQWGACPLRCRGRPFLGPCCSEDNHKRRTMYIRRFCARAHGLACLLRVVTAAAAASPRAPAGARDTPGRPAPCPRWGRTGCRSNGEARWAGAGAAGWH